MKVAMVGLGKLGLPVSCAMVLKGYEVFGYDTDTARMKEYKQGHVDLYEPKIGMQLLACLNRKNGLHIVDKLEDAVRPAEIIFIAVPTPSRPDGAFDTSIVANAIADVADIMKTCDDYKVVSIISTVLPTTVRKMFLPVLAGIMGEVPGYRYGLCYNAQFIAMGTVVENMLNPEFVLIGEYNEQSGEVLAAFYLQLVKAPILRMTLESAEMVKMIYNTFIGLKILYANTIMELCDLVPNSDCDVVADAIIQSNKRLLSGRYLRGGLGDGGGCHPRDQRALAWLAEELRLSVNPFQYISETRRLQTEYIARMAVSVANHLNLPIAVYGLTFKPETNLTEDSPAILLVNCIRDLGEEPYTYDPIIKDEALPVQPYVYVIGMRHRQVMEYDFVPGSIIIDPWRWLPHAPEGCTLRRVGVGLEEDARWNQLSSSD